MFRSFIPVAGAAAVLSACAPVQPTMTMPLGASPVLDGGSFSSGGGLTVAVQLVPIGGQTGLCGVWAESERQSVLSKGKAKDVMHTGSAYLDGHVLHRDLAFMRKVPPTDSYAGQEANCIATDRPWQPGDADKTVQIRIPRQVVHLEIEDDGDPSFSVLFRQTGPGA